MIRRYCASREILLTALCIAAALLAGCATTPYAESRQGRWPLVPARLPDPAPNEVVIAINMNSAVGTHAGMFVGSLLSDPAGMYRQARSEDPKWKGPTLADYVRFQMEDGDRVLAFRFLMEQRDADAIAARVREHGWGMPLYCAADVQNQIAGIGPFRTVKPVGWTTPAVLGEELHHLANGTLRLGACVWPDGQVC